MILTSGPWPTGGQYSFLRWATKLFKKLAIWFKKVLFVQILAHSDAMTSYFLFILEIVRKVIKNCGLRRDDPFLFFFVLRLFGSLQKIAVKGSGHFFKCKWATVTKRLKTTGLDNVHAGHGCTNLH